MSKFKSRTKIKSFSINLIDLKKLTDFLITIYLEEKNIFKDEYFKEPCFIASFKNGEIYEFKKSEELEDRIKKDILNIESLKLRYYGHDIDIVFSYNEDDLYLDITSSDEKLTIVYKKKIVEFFQNKNWNTFIYRGVDIFGPMIMFIILVPVFIIPARKFIFVHESPSIIYIFLFFIFFILLGGGIAY
ncbi:MAG: hypothetical protein PHY10_03530, partial [Patescibacteria group bacterium]|nr:hypothetical protein [Patescibacteria group bacterium]